MTGRASAELICKAKIEKYDQREGYYDAYCGQVMRPDLLSREGLIGFNTPAGWHVEIGELPEKTIVRCPEHCTWVGGFPHPMSGDEIPAHWEDAP